MVQLTLYDWRKTRGKEMRAKEFIIEKKEHKISKRQQQSTRGVNTFSDAEKWNADYVAYRLGMAVACTDGTTSPDIDAKSWIGKSKAAFPYSKVEQDMLKKAYKAVGAKYKDLNQGDMNSDELDSTHTVSPVANWQKK
jgi:hypothetical protein